MEELIKGLLEADRAARETVENAERERSELISSLDEKKHKLHLQLEKEFQQKKEMKQQQAKSVIENDYSPEKIDAHNRAVTKRLDVLFEENRDKWVSTLVERALG